MTATALRPRLRGRSHQVAFVVAAALAPVMIALAPGIAARLVIAVYALAIAALFGVSAAYHRGDWSAAARARMRRLDHSMIFLAIAATYTPIAAFALSPSSARLVLPIVWAGAAVGIVVRNVWHDAPAPVAAAPYLVVGWAAVVVMSDVWRSLGVAGFSLVALGGVLYTAGALIYAVRRPDPWPRTFGYHEVFHLLVIGGAALHYLGVAFVALPRA